MASITIDESQLPAVNEWEEGEKYKVELIVEQTSAVNEGEAQFNIERASGRTATPEEEMEVEEDEKTLPSFMEAAQEAEQETGRQGVLTPSQGEGSETQAPEERSV